MERILVHSLRAETRRQIASCSTSAGKALVGNSNFLLLFKWLQKYCDYLLTWELQTHFSEPVGEFLNTESMNNEGQLSLGTQQHLALLSFPCATNAEAWKLHLPGPLSIGFLLRFCQWQELISDVAGGRGAETVIRLGCRQAGGWISTDGCVMVCSIFQAFSSESLALGAFFLQFLQLSSWYHCWFPLVSASPVLPKFHGAPMM